MGQPVAFLDLISHVHSLASSRASKDYSYYFLLRLLYDKAYTLDVISSKQLNETEQKLLPDFLLDASNVLDELRELPKVDYGSLGHIFDEEENSEESLSETSLMWMHAIIRFCKKNNIHFITSPGFYLKFIAFCDKVEPEYIPKLKHGFLYQGIGEFIWNEYFPNANTQVADLVLDKEIASDFRNGVLEFVEQFQNSFELNDEQKSFIKGRIARDERQILSYLNVENLGKLRASEFAGDFADLGVSLAQLFIGSNIPLQIGTMLKIAERIRQAQEIKDKKLQFALSILVFKKLLNTNSPEAPSMCNICSVTYSEVESMSDTKVQEILFSENMCLSHMIARLHIRKLSKIDGNPLMGKDLLLRIKQVQEEFGL